MRRSLPTSLFLIAGAVIGSAQSLTVYSGNGQIVLEQFLTTAPMTVLARDTRGNPVANVPITWTVTQGQGTIVRPAAQTDSSGQATADFLGTAIPFGLSFTQATVTASSSFGSASFIVTTSIIRLPGGGTGSPPLVELLNPPPDNLTVNGAANAILPGAIQVRVSVASGPQAGHLLPNVGIDIHFYNDDEPQPAPFASCRGGIALTDASGVAVCDLVLNDHLGQVQLSAVAGEATKTRPFLLTITPGTPCTFFVTPAGQAFTAAGGAGSFSLTTGSSCSWAAASNVPWVVLTGPVAGSTSANIGFAVATNSGPARNASITVGSQIFNITQAAAGTTGSPLTISTTSLTGAAVGSAYSFALQASGGTPPYQWTVTGLPAGLTQNNGVVSGVPTTSGSYTINLGVTDTARNTAAQQVSLTVGSTPVSTNGPVITNTGFPGGSLNQPYKQAVTFLTSCTSPFGSGPTMVVSSGGLPPGLTLNSPVDKSWVISGTPTAGGTYNFGLTITEVCGRSSSAQFSLAISGSGGGGGGGGSVGAIIASPQTISFTVGAGSSNRPGDVIVSLASSTGAALNYSASIVNATGGPWLSITTGGAGITPNTLTLSASNFQSFAPGVYTAQLALQSAANATVFIPVTLTVSNSAPLTVSPPSLVFVSPVLLAPGNLQQALQITAAAGTHFSVGFATDSQNNWLGVTPGAGDTPTTLTVVVNPVGLRPGTFTGKINITPAGGAPVAVPVALIITAPPSLSFSVPSVDNSYLTNGPSPVPVTVNLASSTSNLNYQIVAPQVGWLTVTPTVGATPSNLSLVFDPTGLNPGVYQTIITATALGGASQPVTLPVTFSVRQAAPTISAILHGASFLPTPLAPGLQVQIVGSNLGPVTQADASPDPTTGQYPTSLAGARVLFDDFAAPVLHASDQRITVLVPYSVAGKSDVRVVAQYRFAQSSPQTFVVADSSPGIFSAGGSQGVIFNEDGSYNGENAGASPGSVIAILGSGDGQTNPDGIDGLIMLDGSLASPLLPVTAQIAGLNAEVISATSAPGQPAGVFLIKIKVPDDAPRGGVVPVYVSIGSASSQDGVTVVISQ